MTAEFWEYDARLGRRFNIDPKSIPSTSPYACFSNNPILFVDQKGYTIGINLFSSTDKKDKKFYKAAESLKSKLDGKDDGVFVVYGHGFE